MKSLFALTITLLSFWITGYSQVTKYRAYEKYWDDLKLNKAISLDGWDSANIAHGTSYAYKAVDKAGNDCEGGSGWTKRERLKGERI